jgi:hypothetical protein
MSPEAPGKRDAPSHVIPSALGSSRLCPRRVVLIARYIDAVTANSEAGKTVPDAKSPQWRTATEDTRAECEAARLALNEHRAEHGC